MRLFFAISCPLFLLLAACLPEVEPHPTVVLRLAGSTAMQPLLEQLIAAYKEQRDYVRVEMRAVGSQAGLDALASGSADIALISREVSSQEKADWQIALLAWDLLTVVVHPDRDLNSLDREQVKEIFTGQITAWRELGVEDGDIQVVTREEGSGTRQYFVDGALAGGRITSTAIVLPREQDVADYIAEHLQAIGYASLATLTPKVMAVTIDGHPAELSTEDYPFFRPFFLVTVPSPSQEVVDFIEFCLGPRGQAIVAEKYRRAGDD